MSKLFSCLPGLRKPGLLKLVGLYRWFVPILLGVLFIAATLALVTGSAASGSSAPNQAETPSEVSFPEAFDEPRSINISPAFGAVSDRITIEVSPGRRNFQPQLELVYSSMAGFGDAGFGWTLETGQVERWRGDGNPTVGDADSFNYSLSGAGGQLINMGDGSYRARLESLYRVFHRSGNGWEMYNGEGILHRFGGTPESRVDGQLWMLDLVQDRNGNTITYSYERVDGALYIKEIHYTGYAPTGDPGANLVLFEYETRPDLRVSYGYSLRQEKTQRLNRISVFASGDLVRRYELAYQANPLNGISMLSQITLVGADDVSRISLRTLEYSTRTLDWNEFDISSWPAISIDLPFPLTFPFTFADSEGRDTGNRLLDVNGDGFSDLVAGNGHWVYLGLGDGNFDTEPDATWSTSLQAVGVPFVETSGDYQGADLGVRLMDVNADGLPDIFIGNPARLQIYLNTGTGWEYSPQWTEGIYGVQSISGQAEVWADPSFDLTTCSPPHCGGEYGDFPSCTLEDAQHVPDCDPENPPEDGTCLPAHCPEEPSYTTPWFMPFALIDEEYNSNGVSLVDVNADGRVDIIWSMERTDWWFNMIAGIPLEVRGVFLNNGIGWVKSPALTEVFWSYYPFVVDGDPQGLDMLDVNGDGLADILGTIAGPYRFVMLGTGSGWELDASYTAALRASQIVSLNWDRQAQGLMPVDFNDDGLVDYLRANGVVTKAYANTGTGWVESPEMTDILVEQGIAFNTPDGKSTGVELADLDGDGLSDIVLHWHAGTGMEALLSGSLRSGLLTRAVSTLGEVTQLEWAPSTQFNNQREDGIQGLPSSLPLVVESRTLDGRGNTYSTTYDYKGGLLTDRQFRGFRNSTQTLPSGLVVSRTFHQEEGLVGIFELEEGIDTLGQVRTRRTTAYEIVSPLPLVTQIRLVQIDQEVIDPGGSRHSRTINAFDDRLNYVSVQRDPDITLTGDETLTQFSWALNDAAGIWALPARVQTFGPNGVLMIENIILYDGLPEGQADLGLPSQSQDLVEPGVYVSRSLNYDRYGNVTSIQNRLGDATTFVYGEPTATYRTQAVDPEGRVVRSEYDPRFGTLLWDMDPAGNVIRNEYDALGRLVKVILPGDESSPYGTQTYTYSPLGDASSQYYRLQMTETPGSSATLDSTYMFDGLGRIYRSEFEGSDDRTIISQSEFDDANNVSRTTRPFYLGEVPAWTEVERDELHRPVRSVEPDGIAISMSYAGARVDLTDRRGYTVSFYRNASGQITEVEQTVGGNQQITHYQYDVLERLVGVTDALGEETRITYDALGRRTRFEDPNAGTFTYRYDAEGNLIEQVGPDGRITNFQYNRAGELIRKILPDGSVVRFTYDTSGRMVQVNDAAGTLQVRYDARGNVSEQRRTVEGRSYLIGYSYDSLGRVRRLTYPDGFVVQYEYDSGGNVARVTDGSGKVIADGMTYSAPGQLLEMEYGNGVQSSYAYDDMQRMTSLLTTSESEGIIQHLEYSYDAGGNILSMKDLAFGASQSFEYDSIGRLTQAMGAYGEETYEYDAVGNLVKKGNYAFYFDPEHPQRAICGLLLEPGGGVAAGIDNNPHANPCAETQAAVSTKNGLTSRRTLELPNPNIARSFAIEYDAYGNVIAKSGWRYVYNAENQLMRVINPTGKVLVENVYDAGGSRVIQRTPQGRTLYIGGIYEEGKTHTSRHVYAGSLLLATVMTPNSSVRLLSEIPAPQTGLTGNPRSVATTSAVFSGLGLLVVLFTARDGKMLERLSALFARIPKRYLYTAVALIIMPAIVAASTAPATGSTNWLNGSGSVKWYYYHSNHLGSVNVVTDEDGKVVERRDYRPFGEPFEWTGPNSGPRELLLTFDGHRYDDATGLYYLGARYYDPSMGRFMTADTQVPDPTNPAALHRYAFSANNPIRYVDPTGHAFWDVFLGIFISLVFIVVAVFAFIVLAPVSITAMLIVGLAFLGAGIMGIVAASQGLGITSADFWISVATGFVIGAVTGAAIAALPTALSAWSGFAAGLANLGANMLVGAAFGAITSTAVHFANGGGAETLWKEALIGAAVGAATSMVFWGLGTFVKATWAGSWASYAAARAANVAAGGLAAVSKLGVLGFIISTGGVVYACYNGEKLTSTAARYAEQAALVMAMTMLMLVFSSPAKPAGVPAWALGGSAGGASSPEFAALQTMPLAP